MSPPERCRSVEGDRLQRIRDLLPGAARRAGMDGDPVAAAAVFRDWRAIVGPHIADHAEPTSLRGGILRVRADSPAWASEIGYLGEEIRAHVNASAGRGLVAEVRVWTGPASRPRTSGDEGPRRASGRDRGRAPDEDPGVGLNRAREAWRSRRSKAVENQRKPW
jgi:predicted nucleic acid-binding Zn ribbon protein